MALLVAFSHRMNLVLCLTFSLTTISQAAIAEDQIKLAPPADALSDIHQDKTVIARAIESLKKDPVMQSRIASGVELLGVYDTGMRFRCDCYDLLVKMKRGSLTWLESAKIAEGKITWPKN